MKPILPTIDATAYLRTVVPVLYGSFLAFIASKVPFIADFFVFVDGQLGSGWRELTSLLATAGVIFGYYWLARQIGRRFPAAERWLVGSSAKPVYVEPKYPELPETDLRELDYLEPRSAD